MYVLIPERGVCRLSKEQGLGVVFWAKTDPIWAKWDPSEQFVRKMDKISQKCSRIGGKNSIISTSVIGTLSDCLPARVAVKEHHCSPTAKAV